MRYPTQPRKPGKPWTTTEIAALRADYPHMPTAAIAKRLNRSRTSVYDMASKLGLRKTVATRVETQKSPELSRKNSQNARKANSPWRRGPMVVSEANARRFA